MFYIEAIMPTIQCFVTFLHDGAKYSAGELYEIEEELAETFCGAGWAKDIDGNIKTGPRRFGDLIVKPERVRVELGIIR